MCVIILLITCTTEHFVETFAVVHLTRERFERALPEQDRLTGVLLMQVLSVCVVATGALTTHMLAKYNFNPLAGVTLFSVGCMQVNHIFAVCVPYLCDNACCVAR